MKCPHCKETNLVMSERSGIEIDYCPDCRGIWLDRGELDKILEHSRKELAAPAPAAPEPRREAYDPRDSRDSRDVYRDRDHHDSRYYKHKRKKSFLEELFD